LLDRAKISFEQNYFYSSANFAFLAQVNASMVYDVAANPSVLSSDSTLFSSKLSELDSKISDLKQKLGKSTSVLSLEWQVSAMQRLAYAENNVRKLLNPQTIVVTVGGGGSGADAYSEAFQKLNDLEFAVAWYNVSNDLYSKIDKANHRVALDDHFSGELDNVLAELENRIAVLPEGEREDIQRRHDSAVLQKSHGWFLSALFDAKTAIAFADAFNDSDGKSLDDILPVLNEKSASLEKRIRESDVNVAWPQLYLDHAKYYLDAAEFYRQQGQTLKALDNAKSGLSLVYLSESLFGLTAEAGNYYAGFSEKDFVPDVSAQGGAQVAQWPPFGLNLSGILVPLLVVVTLLLLAVLLPAVFSRGSNAAVSDDRRRRINSLKEMQLELDKRLLAKRISRDEHKEMHLKYEREILALQQAMLADSRHTVELENVRAELSALQESIHLLRADYRKGLVVRADFERNLKDKSAKVAALSSRIGSGRERKSVKSAAGGANAKIARWPKNAKNAQSTPKKPSVKRKKKKRR